MRPLRSRAIVALLALPLFLVGALQASAQGDEHEHDPFAGVTIEALGGGEPGNTPGQTLALLRITMEPGASIDAHGHPGAVTLHVESGVFGTEFVEGNGVITRAADAGTPAPTEEAATGQELTLESGDSLFYQDARHTMANTGDAPLVLLVSALLDSEEPGFVF